MLENSTETEEGNSMNKKVTTKSGEPKKSISPPSPPPPSAHSPSVKEDDEDDAEDKPLLSKKHLPFPKSVFFIFLNEFCERYSFYGLEAILALFLRNVLFYTEAASTVIYHLFVTISYATPLFGGIFSDSILGKFKTTIYFSIVHSIGSAALAFGALPYFSNQMATLITILSLIVTAIGIGGIKPSVAAFGGDQFKLPEQAEQLVIYFSIYYVSVNIGAALSEIFTPMLRKDVGCFGDDTCYSLAFAVPAILMILSLVAFVSGKRLYKIKPVKESVTLNTLKCISYAIGNRKEKRHVEHWLDYADDKYSKRFIYEIKALFRVLVLLSPLVIFWSLWTQMGTTWTFQATRMNGYLTESYSIKPDQIQVTNSALILFLVPFFDAVLYPILGKCGCLVKAIPRITLGSFFMSASFIIAGTLEIQLAKSYPDLPTMDETSFNFINTVPCTLNITISPLFQDTTNKGSSFIPSTNSLLNAEGFLSKSAILGKEYENVVFTRLPAIDYNISVAPLGNDCRGNATNPLKFASYEALPQPAAVLTFLLKNIAGVGVISPCQTHESLTKSDEANAKVRILGDLQMFQFYKVDLSSLNSNYSNLFTIQNQETLPFEVLPGIYSVTLTGIDKNKSALPNETIFLGPVKLETGGSYLMGIFEQQYTKVISLHLYTLTKPNVIHILWQLPQYIMLTLAEILIAITGYHFAYQQAPESMKSTLQSFWLLTVAGGNLIIIIVVAFDFFPNQAVLFFFFAGLMLFGAFIFLWLGHRYVPLVPEYEVDPSASRSDQRFLPTRRQSIAETVATGVK